MNKEINELLDKLEPEIDKKCMDIKKMKKNQILYSGLLFLFITIPIFLILFNINIIYFIIGIIIITLLIIFIKLPNLLNNDVGGVCYE